MTLVWVICGAGHRVGKTHLAQKLCELLPSAVYAKQGCGPKQSCKPPNFFRTQAELVSFLDASREDHEHVIVESNELARAGQGDIIIYVDGIPWQTDYRPDVELLRSRSHLHISPSTSAHDWKTVLRRKLQPATLCEAVCDVLLRHQRYQRQSGPAVCRVEPLRISTLDTGNVCQGSTTGAPPVRDTCDVVVEELLTIMVEGVGSFAVMCTPCDVKALAVGFAFSEGLISSIDDVADLSYRPDQRVVAVRVADAAPDVSGRNLIVTSSCGLCGSRNIDRLMAGRLASRDSLRVPALVLRVVTERMHARQGLFAQTGGTHAAGIFSADGELIAFGEDIGRHNALDKAVGQCLMQGLPLAGCGVVLSGRVSLELVAKAARAGLEIIAAVSAPSSLAIQAAERCNITLCGFVRGERATVYTHSRRIEGLDANGKYETG